MSAHHAILQGAVSINGECCKSGRTVLNPRDVVSLKLEQSLQNDQDQLIAWQGSAAVAAKLDCEGKNISDRKRDVGKRKGRMMPILESEECSNKRIKSQNASAEISELSPFIQYYREKLGHVWKADIHESALAKPLPLTIRVLKSSDTLEAELVKFGFRFVTENDFSLELYSKQQAKYERLDALATDELLRNTWILANDDVYQKDSQKKQELGIFLSDARISGEILQQELNSMLPVSILAAILKNNSQKMWSKGNVKFLDLCAAPGSKTCQLLNVLNTTHFDSKNDLKPDYTVIANELIPQRANRTRTRCFFQGNKTLSHLVVTSGDGRQYSSMSENYFDFVICDVPCSGDGTIRKSPEKLRKWTPDNARKNKPLQKELLTVGLRLLKPTRPSDDFGGGVLLYSTCSLNPMENDEVIHEVLDVMNKEGIFNYDIVDVTDLSRNKQVSFLPGQDGFLRVLPASSHGGFFVCALRKSRTNDSSSTSSDDKNLNHSVNNDLTLVENETLSYYISPCTRQCCSDLAQAMQNSSISFIGCGVPVFHRPNGSQYILQEGCSCLENRSVVPSFDITETDITDCISIGSNRLTIPFTNTSKSCRILKSNIPCIVKIHKLDTILPAKLLEIDQTSKVVTLEVTARPQIMKRVACNIDCN